MHGLCIILLPRVLLSCIVFHPRSHPILTDDMMDSLSHTYNNISPSSKWLRLPNCKKYCASSEKHPTFSKLIFLPPPHHVFNTSEVLYIKCLISNVVFYHSLDLEFGNNVNNLITPTYFTRFLLTTLSMKAPMTLYSNPHNHSGVLQREKNSIMYSKAKKNR